jgi:hypothetical protein
VDYLADEFLPRIVIRMRFTGEDELHGPFFIVQNIDEALGISKKKS